MLSAAEDLGYFMCRRLANFDGLVIPSNLTSILIIDNGCTNIYQHVFNVDGALLNVTTNSLQLVHDCYTCVILLNNKFPRCGNTLKDCSNGFKMTNSFNRFVSQFSNSPRLRIVDLPVSSFVITMTLNIVH